MITQSRFRGYSARKNLSPSSSLTLFDPSKINKDAAKNQQGTPGTLTLIKIFLFFLFLCLYFLYFSFSNFLYFVLKEF